MCFDWWRAFTITYPSEASWPELHRRYNDALCNIITLIETVWVISYVFEHTFAMFFQQYCALNQSQRGAQCGAERCRPRREITDRSEDKEFSMPQNRAQQWSIAMIYCFNAKRSLVLNWTWSCCTVLLIMEVKSVSFAATRCRVIIEWLCDRRMIMYLVK